MIRRSKFELAISIGRQRSLHILLFIALLYAVFLFFEFPFVSRRIYPPAGGGGSSSAAALATEDRSHSPLRPFVESHLFARSAAPQDHPARRYYSVVSGLTFDSPGGGGSNFSELHWTAREAWEVGRRLFEELKSRRTSGSSSENRTAESCQHSVMVKGEDFARNGRVMMLPCGLTLGSHVTLIASPYRAHAERDPKIAILKEGDEDLMVSQFMMELQGLKTVDGEEPPRILHLNPRLKGDWSGRPVIEMNTCYRMQWGTGQRCEGWKSRADEETGECEKLRFFGVFFNQSMIMGKF